MRNLYCTMHIAHAHTCTWSSAGSTHPSPPPSPCYCTAMLGWHAHTQAHAYPPPAGAHVYSHAHIKGFLHLHMHLNRHLHAPAYMHLLLGWRHLIRHWPRDNLSIGLHNNRSTIYALTKGAMASFFQLISSPAHLPVQHTRNWHTASGQSGRIAHCTMQGARVQACAPHARGAPVLLLVVVGMGPYGSISHTRHQSVTTWASTGPHIVIITYELESICETVSGPLVAKTLCQHI